MTAPDSSPPDSSPLVVVKGDATPQEVAALLVVLQQARATAEGGSPGRPSEWSAHHRKLRANHPHGPGGWRSSGLPR